MANVYAIKAGNWSDPTVWNTGALPTSADDVFSNNFTVTINQNVTVLSIRNTAASPAVAGGGFILNSGVTVTTTGATGLSASSSLIDFPSNGTATINCGTGNIVKPTTSTATLYTIRVSGGGTLNVTGNISFVSSNSRAILINTTAGATLNFTGNIDPGTTTGIQTDVNCTVNIIGNIYGVTSNGPLGAVQFQGNGTLNITGDIYGSYTFNNNGYGVHMGLGNLNITGNIYGSTTNAGGSKYGVFLSNVATVYITGNIYGGTSLLASGHWGLFTTSAVYLNQVGGIFAGYNIGGLSSTNANAIHILSGPFVCSEYGFFPYQLVRMNLIPTSNSYFEFRDETTNGALSPGAIAPATRMISPSAASDAPSVSDVRFGTVYALGSQTGTVRIPHPNNVSYGVPVDNTFGTAVLSPQDVWNYARTNLTTPGSIGERLKNVSTVDSTGDQLSALL